MQAGLPTIRNIPIMSTPSLINLADKKNRGRSSQRRRVPANMGHLLIIHQPGVSCAHHAHTCSSNMATQVDQASMTMVAMPSNAKKTTASVHSTEIKREKQAQQLSSACISSAKEPKGHEGECVGECVFSGSPHVVNPTRDLWSPGSFSKQWPPATVAFSLL